MKKYHTCKKYFIWNPGTFFFETGIYLKSIVGDSIIACNEIRNVPVNSDDKMPWCKILHMVLLVTILIFIITAIWHF